MKNLANAAFFATKKLETRIKKLEADVEEIKKSIRKEDIPPTQES